jgi:hypothetical protein
VGLLFALALRILKILKLKLNLKVNDIDQENGETSVHQANYTFTHV